MVYVNDSIDQGTTIRIPDFCYIVQCTSDGLTLSDNQCSTTSTTTTSTTTNSTECTMQQTGEETIVVNNGLCRSRDRFPRERCGGYCESDSNDQCKCCGVATTRTQAVVFDCFTDNSKTKSEQRTIEIRRIESCSCNICQDRCSVRQFDSAPLRINNNQCISRVNLPRERCGGQCESDSATECTCCSIAKTYIQPIVFDCYFNGSLVAEQKTVDIRRIQSCNCNACAGEISNTRK